MWSRTPIWGVRCSSYAYISHRVSKRYYAVYVLVILMLLYLTSQTDRFVLGLTSYRVSHDLRIGHMTCYHNESNEDSDCMHE